MISHIKSVLNHMPLLLYVRFPGFALKHRKLVNHTLDLRSISDFIGVRRTVNHVSGIVSPAVHEKVLDQENQRPVEILHGYIKIAEYPIRPFDTGKAMTMLDATSG